MKFIFTTYNENDFDSDVIETPLTWNEFKTKVFNALECKTLKYKDIEGKGNNYEYQPLINILYPNTYWIKQDDDTHIMIRHWNVNTEYEETIMFRLLEENDNE